MSFSTPENMYFDISHDIRKNCKNDYPYPPYNQNQKLLIAPLSETENYCIKKTTFPESRINATFRNSRKSTEHNFQFLRLLKTNISLNIRDTENFHHIKYIPCKIFFPYTGHRFSKFLTLHRQKSKKLKIPSFSQTTTKLSYMKIFYNIKNVPFLKIHRLVKIRTVYL